MSTIFVDIETYYDFFYIGMKRHSDGKRIGVEFSRRCPTWDREWVRNVLAAQHHCRLQQPGIRPSDDLVRTA